MMTRHTVAMVGSRFLWLCAALSPMVVSQAPARWAIPAHGAVLWQVEDTVHWSDAAGKPVGMWTATNYMAPVLFADELEASQRRLAMPPWDFGSLGPWLAMDLSTLSLDGAFDWRFDRVMPFGEVRFVGRARRTQDGWQEFAGELSRADVAPKDADQDFLRVERHYLSERLQGSMTVRRRFDERQGRLLEFAWSVDAKMTHTAGQQRRPFTVGGGQHWTLAATLPNRFPASAGGPAFDARVDAAIQRGAARQLATLGAFSDPSLTDGEGRGNFQGPSLHALMLFGLARAGHRVGEAGIDAALARLPRRPLTEPHGLAMAMLALAELYAPRDERRQRVLGGAPPAPRTLPLDERRWLRVLGDRLLAAAGRADEDHPGLWWGFVASMNEYEQRSCWLAVAALDRAVACGLQVPKGVWAGAARHFLASQLHGDERVDFTVRSEGGGDAGGKQLYAAPGGWPQSPRKRAEYCTGDATAGAMVGLCVCRRRLPASHALQPEIGRALDAGFAWLLQHGTPRHGPAELPVHHQCYEDYSLALALLLDESGVRWLGPRDLYFEQALALQQREEDGQFPGSVAGTPSALALLRPSPTPGPITPSRGGAK